MPSSGQRVAHLDRRPHRPQRVVLVHDRHAEHGHHRVADELLDGAAVALDDRLHPLEVAREQRAQRLRVEPLAERGRAGDVAEEDGHGLALLARRRGVGERRAAGVAEARTLRDVVVAALAQIATARVYELVPCRLLPAFENGRRVVGTDGPRALRPTGRAPAGGTSCASPSARSRTSSRTSSA